MKNSIKDVKQLNLKESQESRPKNSGFAGSWMVEQTLIDRRKLQINIAHRSTLFILHHQSDKWKWNKRAVIVCNGVTMDLYHRCTRWIYQLVHRTVLSIKRQTVQFDIIRRHNYIWYTRKIGTLRSLSVISPNSGRYMTVG